MAAMRLEQVQRFILAKKIFWGYCTLKYQNPSSFACLMLIRAIVIFTPLGKQKKSKLNSNDVEKREKTLKK